MTETALMRTEYRDPDDGTVKTGATGHGEILTDIESYLLPLDRARGANLHSWGVASGLSARATTGQAGLVVTPGAALDASGRISVLMVNGAAITNPNVSPNGIKNIPTVPVTADGIVLATAQNRGESFLTLTWREVLGESVLTPGGEVLVHAPWVRLVPVAGFQDVGAQVVLAQVSLDGAGNVIGLTTAGRRLAGLPAGRLELRAPQVQAGGSPRVDDHAAAELLARPDGGVELNLLSRGVTRPALSVDGVTGTTKFGSGLQVTGEATFAPGVPTTSTDGRTFGISSGDDGKLHVADATAAVDLMVIDGTGRVGIGIGAGQAKRTLHVEADGVHSGGTGNAGFSFADRSVGEMIDNPGAGERWVWYAQDGSARLWSGSDFLTVSATARLVSMATKLEVHGESCAQKFCNLSDGRLKTDIADVLEPLDQIAKLRGVRFRWRRDEVTAAMGGLSDAPELGVGVIAQEVADVFPELVSSMGEDDHLTVDYSGLTAVLVECVKALKADNENLRRRMDDLQDRVSAGGAL